MNLLARFVGGLSQRLLAVLFAVSAAQFPIYFAAYENTVAGARTEAEARFHELQREAAQLQLEVEAFIQRHEASTEEAFLASGRIHRTTQAHYLRYTAMDDALRAAPLWQRPLVLAQNFDPQLHAVMRFEPGLALTLEAGVYALIGLLLAWLMGSLIGRLWPENISNRSQ